MTLFIRTREVKAQVAAMEIANIEVEKDYKLGTVVAKSNGVEVYRALKKGSVDAWIVRHKDDLFVL